MSRTIDWDGRDILIIDQTRLPHDERTVRLHRVEELAEAITRLRVRGAPALGVAGALGLALAIRRAQEAGQDIGSAVDAAAGTLAATRPTATNLAWGINQAREALSAGPEAVVQRAVQLLEADVAINRALAQRGADLLGERQADLGHYSVRVVGFLERSVVLDLGGRERTELVAVSKGAKTAGEIGLHLDVLASAASAAGAAKLPGAQRRSTVGIFQDAK